MTKRLRTTLGVAFAGAIALTGCGAGDYGVPGGAGPGAPPATGKEAVAQCEQSIASAPQLSGKVKKELEDVCKDAAGGDEQAVRKATQQVCEAIIEESVPSGPARTQALAACKRGP